MSEITLAPRRRPLWRLFIMPVLLLVAAAAWSAFWFYSASRWTRPPTPGARGRPDPAGSMIAPGARWPAIRSASKSAATAPAVSLVSQTAGQAATQTPITAKLGEILVVAQVYDPKLLIAEFTAPATISERGQQPSMVANWRTARSSVVGLPGVPQRVSLVFDDPAIDRVDGSQQTPLARAKHIELHGRLAEGSPSDHPVIETVLQIAGGSVQDVHPLLAEPFDADVRALLSGLKDFSPKPWPQRFREIQAAGGHVEIVQSRIQQGDLIAVAAGSLGLSAQGRLDGELQMTVAGLEKVIPALGIEKMLDEGVPQATLDRVAPGVKSSDVQQSARRAGPGDSRSRQGGQAERQCRRRRRHQRARYGGGAGRQEGESLPAALRRRRGVPRPAQGSADPGAVLRARSGHSAPRKNSPVEKSRLTGSRFRGVWV